MTIETLEKKLKEITFFQPEREFLREDKPNIGVVPIESAVCILLHSNEKDKAFFLLILRNVYKGKTVAKPL